jgi:hypothetical protein
MAQSHRPLTPLTHSSHTFSHADLAHSTPAFNPTEIQLSMVVGTQNHKRNRPLIQQAGSVLSGLLMAMLFLSSYFTHMHTEANTTSIIFPFFSTKKRGTTLDLELGENS